MYLYTNQNSKLVLTPFNNVLTSSSDITDSHAISLISRMTASGETPTVARQLAINNCIVALKANNLFQNQFDVLVTTRSQNAQNRSSYPIWMLASNTTGAYSYGTVATEKLEAYWMGQDLSPSRYLIFQSIMNAYFAAF